MVRRDRYCVNCHSTRHNCVYESMLVVTLSIIVLSGGQLATEKAHNFPLFLEPVASNPQETYFWCALDLHSFELVPEAMRVARVAAAFSVMAEGWGLEHEN